MMSRQGYQVSWALPPVVGRLLLLISWSGFSTSILLSTKVLFCWKMLPLTCSMSSHWNRRFSAFRAPRCANLLCYVLFGGAPLTCAHRSFVQSGKHLRSTVDLNRKKKATRCPGERGAVRGARQPLCVPSAWSRLVVGSLVVSRVASRRPPLAWTHHSHRRRVCALHGARTGVR